MRVWGVVVTVTVRVWGRVGHHATTYTTPHHTPPDPYNAAIIGGLFLAATQTPMTSLGPFGRAVGQLAAAQTPLLFLIIGLKVRYLGYCSYLLGSRYYTAIYFSIF